MSLAFAVFKKKSRLKALLDHFSILDDPREPWRVAHPLREVRLRLAMADCDSIASWGEANPYEHGEVRENAGREARGPADPADAPEAGRRRRSRVAVLPVFAASGIVRPPRAEAGALRI